MQKHDFLFEIQCEELPANAQKNLMMALCEGFKKQCQQQLNFKSVNGFVSPRHLGFIVEALDAMQPAQTIMKKGPALHLAFDQQGQPTPQCIGFAKSLGVTPADLQVMDVKEGQCVSYTQTRAGKHVRELLPEMIHACLKSLPIAKRMRWGDKSTEFLRPVHGVIALLDDEIIEMECFGHHAGRETMGHRFLSPERFSIQHVSEYHKKLSLHHVLADFFERQNLLREQIIEHARDAKPCMPDELLEEVTGLVEWPRALIGEFDAGFLQLPREVLLAAMQNHQRYFALEKKSSNDLLNKFIFITHLTCSDPKLIIEGNERVLRARLADAQFFYDKDRQHSLQSRVERLKEVVFQQKLGTMFGKSERIKKMMLRDIAPVLKLDLKQCELAATLMKTDLLTEMVGEFPELQGVMGKYYALHDGHPKAVAEAIEEQYAPRQSGISLLGRALALADRIDTLHGFFAIGMTPTGDKDPYGLRRAAIDVVDLLMSETLLNLNLRQLLEEFLYHADYAPSTSVVDEVYAFILERAKHVWMNLDDYSWLTADVYQSVVILQPPILHDAFMRMKAVAEFRGKEEGMALAAANKRVKNILEKTSFQSSDQSNPDYFVLDEEKKLYTAMQQVRALQANTHRERLEQLATLRPAVDDFFDHVMVMVDDEKLRHNRLQLLAALRALFLSVADIALLQ